MRLIDADALLDDLKSSAKDAREWKEETQDEEIKIRAEQTFGTFVECALRVKNAPTIKPEVRHGRWIPYGRDSSYNSFIRCSHCNHEVVMYADSEKSEPKCCEECGYRMDGGADNEHQV